MFLFLDDNHRRTREFLSNYPRAYHSATAQGCIKKLEHGVWEIVFLDHDLEGEREHDPTSTLSGMEVVRWIKTNKPRVKLFIIHSQNPHSGPIMVERLRAAGYDAWLVPFGEF